MNGPMWIIQRAEDDGGGYVARPNAPGNVSYTNDLRHVRVFNSEKEAKADCCPDNEYVTTVERELSR